MSKLDAVRDMESAAFSGNWDKFKTYLADDVYYRVGNTAEIKGPQAVVDYMIKLLSTQLGINDMKTRSAWETAETVILELNMKGLRMRDSKNVAYPCIDVYRFNDSGKIQDWKVYAIEPTYVA